MSTSGAAVSRITGDTAAEDGTGVGGDVLGGGMVGAGDLSSAGNPADPDYGTGAGGTAAARGAAGTRGQAGVRDAGVVQDTVAVRSARDMTARAAEDLLPCLTRAFARTRARGWLSASATGLILDLPQRLLTEEFGPHRVMRFEDVDFPPALTHEPTRRFLREVGLPEEAFPFHLDTEQPLPTLAGYHRDAEADNPGSDAPAEDPDPLFAPAPADPVTGRTPGDRVPPQRRRRPAPASRPALPPELPASADHLIRLGRLATAHLLVDGASGALFTWTPDDDHPRTLHADVSTLAFALWLRRLEATTVVA